MSEREAAAVEESLGGAFDPYACPTLNRLVNLIGKDKTVTLAAARGGTTMCVPETITPGCALARIVGVEAARALRDFFGSQEALYVPRGAAGSNSRRIDYGLVAELSARGWSARRIARRVGCSVRQVANIRRTLRETRPTGVAVPPARGDR